LTYLHPRLNAKTWGEKTVALYRGLTVIVIYCDTHKTHQPAAWRKAVVHNVKTFGTNVYIRQIDL